METATIIVIFFSCLTGIVHLPQLRINIVAR